MHAPDYRQLFEATPGRYLVLDRDLRIVAVSDAYLRATVARREEIVGRQVFEAFPINPQGPAGGVEQEATVRAVLERALAEGAPQRVVLQRCDLRRPAGRGGGFERRYWTSLITPLRGPGGEVEHLLCTVEDVTDRARDARLGKLMSVDAVGMVFFDPAGMLISANDTFLAWTGYTREEVAEGRINWQVLTPPEHHAASLDALEQMRATGRIGPYEKEYLTKSGERRWLLFVGSRLDDGTIMEYVIDVSDRKAAELAKRESDERYRTLFDSIDAGFCVLEMIYRDGRAADYRFVEVNRAFEPQTGLRDATAKTMREHVPEHEQHWFDIYARVAESGEPARFVEEAKGLGRWYDVSAFAAGQPGSGRVGVLFNDITARVRAEQALKAEATRKDEFIATLAHELRNPLAPILNAVSILRLHEQSGEELRRLGELIDRQVHHLVRLVDDLLDVSRVTFGKVQLRRERVDLRSVAREAVTTSEPLLAAGAHRLILQLARDPVWVDGDPVRLAQVISNLLNNAARYTPSRTPAGAPSSGRAGGEITLQVGTLEGAACIAVADSGIGIEPALLERVFEPFVQLERREAGGMAGIGIGLALARALVELHGGRISAESAGPGQGSRFVVTLPLAAAPEARELVVAPAARAVSRRFLVVDDNIDATDSQAALLRLLGHQVETAYSGAVALEKARAFRPEIVLLDLGMPGMDGFEVARRLRAMREGREVLLVAQTGWGQEEDRRRTREAGFDAHFAKPLDMAALMQLL
jgi:PAS domain S-box-containing protein